MRYFRKSFGAASDEYTLPSLGPFPGITERFPVQPAVGFVDHNAEATADVMALASVLDCFVTFLRS